MQYRIVKWWLHSMNIYIVARLILLSVRIRSVVSIAFKIPTQTWSKSNNGLAVVPGIIYHRANVNLFYGGWVMIQWFSILDTAVGGGDTMGSWYPVHEAIRSYIGTTYRQPNFPIWSWLPVEVVITYLWPHSDRATPSWAVMNAISPSFSAAFDGAFSEELPGINCNLLGQL